MKEIIYDYGESPCLVFSVAQGNKPVGENSYERLEFSLIVDTKNNELTYEIENLWTGEKHEFKTWGESASFYLNEVSRV